MLDQLDPEAAAGQQELLAAHRRRLRYRLQQPLDYFTRKLPTDALPHSHAW